jgi:Tetracyclin repressor-like, C-terminal domain
LFHTQRSDLAFIGASEMRSVEAPNQRRIAARRTAVQHLLDVEISAACETHLAQSQMPAETGRAIATMCTSLPQWFRPDGGTSPRAISHAYASRWLPVHGLSLQPALDELVLSRRVGRRDGMERVADFHDGG